jgi:hypothetical protein
MSSSSMEFSASPRQLAEELTGLAQAARRHAVEGNVVALHGLLERVRLAADSAAGDRLLMLSVAEAFLRALARSDLGRSELVLRRFFVEHAEQAEVLFSALLARGQVTRAEVDETPGSKELIDVGVLRVLKTGAVDIRPSARALARELVSPAPLRWWEKVEHARVVTAASKLDKVGAAAFLASQLGVTEPEAARHLRAHPLATRTRADSAGRGERADRAEQADAPFTAAPIPHTTTQGSVVTVGPLPSGARGRSGALNLS